MKKNNKPTKTLSEGRKRALKKADKNAKKHEAEKIKELPAKIEADKARRKRHAEHLKACAAKALRKAEAIEAKEIA